jgi:hypothetical protein
VGALTRFNDELVDYCLGLPFGAVDRACEVPLPSGCIVSAKEDLGSPDVLPSRLQVTAHEREPSTFLIPKIFPSDGMRGIKTCRSSRRTTVAGSPSRSFGGPDEVLAVVRRDLNDPALREMLPISRR